MGSASLSAAENVTASSPRIVAVAWTLFFPGWVKETVTFGSSRQPSASRVSTTETVRSRIPAGIGLTKYGSFACRTPSAAVPAERTPNSTTSRHTGVTCPSPRYSSCREAEEYMSASPTVSSDRTLTISSSAPSTEAASGNHRSTFGMNDRIAAISSRAAAASKGAFSVLLLPRITKIPWMLFASEEKGSSSSRSPLSTCWNVPSFCPVA